MLLTEYFRQWIETYKRGAVRKVTLNKYNMSLAWLEKLAPNVKIEDLTRAEYQRIINLYAEKHERQTVSDFNTHLKAAVLDAMDEGLITRDPTRKVVIKGKPPRDKKPKFLNQAELKSLLDALELGEEPSWDWLILLIAKTGMRFSEAMAITPADFDFKKQTLNISKTWNYKEEGGFAPTKNKSSVRKIPIDWKTVMQFHELTAELPPDKPIFVREGRAVYNSTANDVLERRCKKAGVPLISVHGLRHTHASILLFNGVSIASVARRLGHADMTTTQKVYLHIVQELENKDANIVMMSMVGL